jgi:methylmalonyl-CoA mutase
MQGGMTAAVESGWAKLRIETSAAQKQGRIDSGQDVIVGLNRFTSPIADAVQIRDIDNSAVVAAQRRRLESVRATRDASGVAAALQEIGDIARSGTGNLLSAAIKAMRARATVGEVSLVLEQVFGRHRAEVRRISGVYSVAYGKPEEWAQLQDQVRAFAVQHGRQPRVLLAKLGQDGHDRGARIIATTFADLGFDVDIAPLFMTPEECARQAIENDVHAIGISSLTAGHQTLVPALLTELRQRNAGDITVFVGGIVPPADRVVLTSLGVAGIFGPGTPVLQSAGEMLAEINRRVGGSA